MKLFFASCLLAITISACAGKVQFTQTQAQDEIQRLMGLYNDARAKFVVALQDLEKGDQCDKAATLATEAEALDKAASLPKEQWDALTVVKMELAEAAKICNSK